MNDLLEMLRAPMNYTEVEKEPVFIELLPQNIERMCYPDGIRQDDRQVWNESAGAVRTMLKEADIDPEGQGRTWEYYRMNIREESSSGCVIVTIMFASARLARKLRGESEQFVTFALHQGQPLERTAVLGHEESQRKIQASATQFMADELHAKWVNNCPR